MSIKMSTINYTVLTQGGSSFFKNFAIPLVDELDTLNSIKHKKLPENAVLSLDSRIRNHDVAIVGLMGVILFLPGLFAVKVLDELYEIKIKPKVQKIIRRADEIEIFKSKKKCFVQVSSIFHEELNTLIIVAAKESDLEQFYKTVEQLNVFAQVALRNLKATSQKDKVHLYIATEEKINLKPFIHENLESALSQINS